jgi:hypothetical protein
MAEGVARLDRACARLSGSNKAPSSAPPRRKEGAAG